VKRWLRDASFRGLLRNTGYLAISRIAAGPLSLGALAFTTHALGTSLFGMLILIHSYAFAASGIAKFQSWQVVIRYGAPAMQSDDREQLQHGISFAMGLDLLSGIAGMAAAMALLPFIAPWLHIGPDLLPIAILYCTVLPTMASATPVGVLRLLDRFDIMSWQGLVTPAIRVVLAGTAWLLSWPFEAYLLIWYVSDLVGDLVIWALALRELHRRDLLRGLRPALRGPARKLSGAWKFALTTNLTTSLAAAWGPVANLLVGALLSPAAAGQYRVAASLVEAANKPADMLQKAFYPEVMRLDLSRRKPWKLMLRGAALSGSLALAFIAIVLLAGPSLITILFGKGFSPAFALLMMMLFGLLMQMLAFPLSPMLYAVDRPGVPLNARIVSAVLYLLAIYPATMALGLNGAGLAYVLAMLLMFLLMVPPLYGEYRRRTAQAPGHAG